MTLNDPERRNGPYLFCVCHRIRQIFRPIISQWLKIDSTVTVVLWQSSLCQQIVASYWKAR